MDGTVSAGSATITSSGNTLEITQTTNRAVIDWRSFDIAPGETTRFIQPSSSAIVLNRINSANPSQIFGRLDANGNVIIVNPSGVLFGAGSQVDVNGLLATTANIGNDAFMASGPLLFNQPGNPTASIVNNGNITAGQAGLVGLVAPNVINNGTITANLGTVHLSSADTFTLDLYGDGLMSFAVGPSVQSQLVHNAGSISAAGGKIALTAAAGNNVVNSLIKVEGELKAPAVAQRNGKIYIYAEGKNAVADNIEASKGQRSGRSSVEIAGTLDASGVSAGQTGGNISVLGDDIKLLSGTVLNANGDSGGGYVQVGGDFHGVGVTPTALTTYVDSAASIFADALTSGNGGNVAVWSDGSTQFLGNISAKGGAQSGNGGFVETSGHLNLDFKGLVNTSAVNGTTGTLLLDPTNITISTGTHNANLGSGPNFEDNTTDTNAILNTATLASALTANNIVVSTASSGAGTGTITVSNPISWSSGNSLTLLASSSIAINSSITGSGSGASFSATSGMITTGGGITLASGNTISMNNGSITFNAGSTSNSTLAGTLTAGTGSINFNLAGSSTVSGIISGSSSVALNGTGTTTFTGANTYTGSTTINSGTLQVSSLANGGSASNIGSSSNAASNLVLAGGTLRYNSAGSVTIDRGFTLANSTTSTINIATNVFLRMTGASANTTGSFILNNSTTSGQLYLSGANAYSGTTTLTAGILQIGNSSALGTSTLVANGGTLQNDGGSYTLANPVSVNSNLTISGSGTVGFSGAISGSATINRNAGTLYLGGNNSSYSGGMAVASGVTLRVGHDNALGSSTLSLNGGTLSFISDTALALSNSVTVTASSTVTSDRVTSGAGVTNTIGALSIGTYTLTGSAGGNVTSGAAGVNFGATTLVGNTTFAPGTNFRFGLGALSDGGSTARTLTNNGAGILALNAAASSWALANTLVINNGTVQLGATNALGTGTTTAVTVNKTTTGGTALFDLNDFNQGILNLTLGGTSGTSTSVNNVSTGAGTLTLGGSVSYANNGNPLSSTISGNLSLGGAARTFTIGDSSNAAQDLTISANVSNGGLIKAGAGTLTLSGSSTYTLNSSVTAGTLQLTSADAYGGSSALSAVTGGTLAITNANALGSSTLNLNGGTISLISDTGITVNNNITIAASSTVRSDRVTSGAGTTNTLGSLSIGAFTLTGASGSNVTSGTAGINFGATTITGNSTFAPGSGFQLGLGALSDGGSTARTITSNGLGTLLLNSTASNWALANTLAVNNGTVRLGASNALGTGTTTAVTVAAQTASATALFDLNGYNQGIGSMTLCSACGTATNNNVSTGTGTLTLGGNISYINGNTGWPYYYPYSPGGSTISGNLDLGGVSRTFSVDSSASANSGLTISAVVSNGSLIKAGAGNLYLTANNIYSGGTTISAGILQITNPNQIGSGTLSLGGGTLNLVSDTPMNFSNNLTLTGSSTIIAGRASAGAAVTNTFATFSPGTYTLTGVTGSNVTSGTAEVAFGTIAPTGNPIFAPAANFQFGLGALSDGGIARTITQGGLGRLILQASSSNWTAANSLVINNGTVQLGASNALGMGTTTTVTIANSAASGTSLFDLNGYNQGIASLVFCGTCGAASNNNVSTGAGTLTLGGNVFYTNGNTGWPYYTPYNPGSSTISGNLNLGGSSRTFTVDNSANAAQELIVSALVSNGGLIKAGAGTLYLTANNSYSGGTTISGGILEISNLNAMGSTASTLTFNGGSLQGDSNGPYTIVNPVTISGNAGVTGSTALTFSGPITLSASSTFTNSSSVLPKFNGGSISLGANNLTIAGAGNVQIDDNISGTGSIGMAGTGTLYLTGNNTYSGGTGVSSGILEISHNNALGTGTLALSNGATVQGDGLSAYVLPNGLSMVSAALLGAVQTGTIAGDSSLTFNGGLQSICYWECGNTLINNATAPIMIAGVSISAVLPSWSNLTISGSGNTTISGVIATAAFSGSALTMSGTGTLYLTGNNTYNRGTTVSSGTLKVGNNSALGTGALTLSGGAIEGDGTARTLTNALALAASSTITGSSSLTFSGAVTESASATLTNNNSALTSFTGSTFSLGSYALTVAGGGTTQISNVISGTGGSIIENAPGGTLYLSGNNTYTGGTTLSGGILEIGHNNAFGTGTLSLNGGTIKGNGSSTYTITNPVTIAASSGFTGGSALTFSGAATLTASSTLTSNSTNVTAFAGNTLAMGANNLTLQGSGTISITDTITGTGSIINNYTLPTLTVTASYQSIVYGTAPSALLVSYSGFVNGDTVASLTTAPTVTNTASSSNVGTYNGALIPSGAAISGYVIVYQSGNLTITPASLLITANNLSTVYGSAPSTTQVTYSGFVNGDTPLSMTTAPAVANSAPSTNVGTYNNALTPSGAVNNNYTISYQSGNLSITPAPLTIRADAQTITYGTSVPATTVSYSGFVNGDTATSMTTAPTLSSVRSGNQNAGTYSGNYTASGAVNGNYTITYVAGNLIVNPAPLTITASDQSVVYGTTPSTIGVAYNGFVNGDTAASLTTVPTVANSASSTNVGTYNSALVPSGAVNSNYTISYVNGNLSITPAPLTVTAVGQTISYGTSVPTGTVSYSGFVNGDTAASMTAAPTVSSVQSGAPDAGTYTGNYTASGAVNGNYTISYIAGNLVVTPVALTITANSQVITYGTAVPATTLSYSGLVNGDTAASLTTAPTVASAQSGYLNAATYTGNYTVSGAVDSNYTISYVAGNLTVAPAPLVVTVNNQTAIYGSGVPTTTLSYNGFVNGDTAASLTTSPTISSVQSGQPNAGLYTGNYTASGAVNPNYTISYVAGNLRINPATLALLTITADDAKKNFGATYVFNGTEFTASGLLNGDTIGSVTLTSAGAAATAAAGRYAIVPSIAIGGTFDPVNYNIIYTNGTLVVNFVSLPSTVLFATQNVPVYTPPVVNTAIAIVADVNDVASQASTEKSQSTRQNDNNDAFSTQMKQNNQKSILMENGPVKMIGGLLQLDPRAVEEFGLEYLLK